MFIPIYKSVTVFLSNYADSIVDNYLYNAIFELKNLLTNRVNCTETTLILIQFWRVLRDLRATLPFDPCSDCVMLSSHLDPPGPLYWAAPLAIVCRTQMRCRDRETLPASPCTWPLTGALQGQHIQTQTWCHHAPDLWPVLYKVNTYKLRCHHAPDLWPVLYKVNTYKLKRDVTMHLTSDRCSPRSTHTNSNVMSPCTWPLTGALQGQHIQTQTWCHHAPDLWPVLYKVNTYKLRCHHAPDLWPVLYKVNTYKLKRDVTMHLTSDRCSTRSTHTNSNVMSPSTWPLTGALQGQHIQTQTIYQHTSDLWPVLDKVNTYKLKHDVTKHLTSDRCSTRSTHTNSNVMSPCTWPLTGALQGQHIQTQTWCHHAPDLWPVLYKVNTYKLKRDVTMHLTSDRCSTRSTHTNSNVMSPSTWPLTGALQGQHIQTQTWCHHAPDLWPVLYKVNTYKLKRDVTMHLTSDRCSTRSTHTNSNVMSPCTWPLTGALQGQHIQTQTWCHHAPDLWPVLYKVNTYKLKRDVTMHLTSDRCSTRSTHTNSNVMSPGTWPLTGVLQGQHIQTQTIYQHTSDLWPVLDKVNTYKLKHDVTKHLTSDWYSTRSTHTNPNMMSPCIWPLTGTLQGQHIQTNQANHGGII